MKNLVKKENGNEETEETLGNFFCSNREIGSRDKIKCIVNKIGKMKVTFVRKKSQN